MLRKYRKFLLLLIGVAALTFFGYKFRNSISLQGFHWSQVAASIRNASVPFLLLSILTIFLCYAVRSLRWIRFSRSMGKSGFWSVYGATLMGFSCVFLLGRAGEPVRPVLIARKESLSMPGMFGIYFLERIFDIAATVILAGLALVLFQRQGPVSAQESHLITIARSTGVALFIGLVAVIAFLVYFRFHGGEWLSRRLKHPAWRMGFRARLASLLEGFSDGLQAVRTWGDLTVLVGYSALHWTLVVVVYLCVEHAFGGALAAISVGGTILVLAFTLVGSAVQLPGVGGGAQVATYLVLTAVFGIEQGPAATVAISVWLISFASCCLAGIPLLFREGLSMSDLRRITREEERESEADLLAEAERAARVEDSPR
jgi:glycosyltransferase 2 family protein